MTGLLITGARLEDGTLVDVRIAGGIITEVAAALRPAAGEPMLDGAGGGLIPGLHDHHVHLRAMAAAASSIVVGPPSVRDPAAFGTALTQAAASRPVTTWIRAIGYHDSVAGPLSRAILDRIVPLHPLRVQHRSGALWVVNSCGADILGLSGHHNGRLWRADASLHARLPASELDHGAVGAAGARAGVTGFTDADPHRTAEDVAELRRRHEAGELPQRLRLMSPPGLTIDDGDLVTGGEAKYLLDDDRLPSPDELAARIEEAHDGGQRVAVHCVTRAQLVTTVVALDAAGAAPGDRIEHGSVIPPELIPSLTRLGVTVVTQPNFVAERGDRYLVDVDAEDLPHLYRLGSLLDAGIPMAAGTDAPFGDADPWAAIRAAVDRRTIDGDVLGADERIDARRALGLFLGHPEVPALERRVAPGEPGDLCLLDAPLDGVLADPRADHVAATVVAGRLAFSRAAR
jgi:predicted amidohydrolase YtcJ